MDLRDELEFPVKNPEKYLRYVPRYLTHEQESKRKWEAAIKKCPNQVLPTTRAAYLPHKKWRRLISSGVSKAFRCQVWRALSGANELAASHSLDYYSACWKQAASSDELRAVRDDIERDLDRTFPENRVFSTHHPHMGIDMLRRVLVAYTVRNHSVEYCQGMNIIAAWLLLVTHNEEDAFWLLTAIVENLCPRYYIHSMLGCQVDLRILGVLIQEFLPSLWEHFQDLGISLPLLATRWFLCIFVGALPSQTALRVWDNFFLYGTMMLERVGLSVLMLNERKLLGVDQTGHFVRVLQFLSYSCYNHDRLFETVGKLRQVGETRLEHLHSKYALEIEGELEEIRRNRDVTHLARLTHFSQEELEQLWARFRILEGSGRSTRGSTVFNFDQFQNIFSHIVPGWQPNTPAMMQIFRLFDENGDNRIDFRELMVGLSMLASNSLTEKLRSCVCFRAYDSSNRGFLQKDDILSMLEGVHRNLNPKDDIERHQISLHSLVDTLFANLDTTLTGKLCFEDFTHIVDLYPQLVECFFPPLCSIEDRNATGVAGLLEKRSGHSNAAWVTFDKSSQSEKDKRLGVSGKLPTVNFAPLEELGELADGTREEDEIGWVKVPRGSGEGNSTQIEQYCEQQPPSPPERMESVSEPPPERMESVSEPPPEQPGSTGELRLLGGSDHLETTTVRSNGAHFDTHGVPQTSLDPLRVFLLGPELQDDTPEKLRDRRRRARSQWVILEEGKLPSRSLCCSVL